MVMTVQGKSAGYGNILNFIDLMLFCSPLELTLLFPLWYAQEIEGVRTDIKIVNTSLFMTGVLIK
jgi:hypothetical protein